MERACIAELLDYVDWAWERIERTIDDLPPRTFGEAVGGSGWPSLAACCFHATSAYDGWIHGEWALGNGEYIATTDEPITAFDDFKEYRRLCMDAARGVLDLDDDAFYGRQRFEIEPGVIEEMSPADVLSNLVLHERGHHGDVNTIFHQLGVRSYIIDYRYFITRPGEFMQDVQRG